MTEEQLLLKKFRAFIEFVSIPVSILDLEKNRVLASNAAIIHDYGVIFSEFCPIALPFECTATGTVNEDLLLKLDAGREQAALVLTAEEDAEFELVAMSNRLALLFACQKSLKPKLRDEVVVQEVSHKQAKGQSFHFSYIFNFTTGSWTCSNPKELYDKGLLPEGAPVEKLIWRDIICPEDVELYDSIISTAIKHGGNHQLKYRVKRLDGQYIQVDDYCGLTQQGDKWPTLVGTIISCEQSIEQIGEVERQVLAGKLVGGMVHDFKNLLSGIQNILEWCKLKVENSEISHSLGKTIEYTEQATSLIKNVLSVSSGKDEKKIEKIYIANVVNDLKGLLTCIVPSSIQLKIDVAANMPPIYGQGSLLKDMILNLCVNARDAMKEQGDLLCIKVDSEVVVDSKGRDQHFIKLVISDNGCGMTDAEVKSIFNAFYSTKETGTGLGLWMVNEAICAFDGSVDVSSELGKGTAFEIRFPVIEKDVDISSENAAVKVEEDIPHESFVFEKNKTVLFIEDEPLIRSGVSSWLESWGINLLVADDGHKALEMFFKHQDEIDAVIQDYILPGKRGDELLEIFSKTLPELPIIVTSGSPDHESMKSLKSKGAYAFVEKPFKMEDLFSLLYEILED